MKTVLITGGSSGIGYEMSRLFARDGYRLLWVAKPPEELSEAQARLEQEFAGVETHSLAKDLSVNTAAREVYNWTHTQGWTVDVLVNNAGFATYGNFETIDMDKELAMIGVNVTNVLLLTRYFLVDMLARDAGKIMNISSGVSYEAMPKMATYAGSKAFVRLMSQSLHEELKHRKSKVQVTTVCPSAIKNTRFQSTAGMQKVRTFSSIATATPQEVAKDAYRGLLKGKRLVITGAKYRLNKVISQWVPKALTRWVIRKEMEEISR
ncbi:SDR family NAD(P)-dependent oxidoreductase [Microscilla marina]|uniref:Short-chain dehydrogenase n=1 Tax=Microscilla marina ATCC 23134 TaxID=313606 RepID=A1ZZI2_MICM2|nr:SDR family NAD(P)-dependent oxidoreductase [Microscilla marina]EAY24228.1 short-chain dehydrogenase [Microscilla marina ATCC 23134]